MERRLSHVRLHIKWYVLIVLIMVSITLWSVIYREDNNNILTFTVLDVGQGDSLFIESPTGIQVLVDAGANRNVMKEISKVLPWYDRHIDMIVVTHPDRDHYEGFISLLRKYRTDVLLESGTKNTNDGYKVFEDLIEDKKIKKVTAIRGHIVDLGGGAYLDIIFPDRDVSGIALNESSIVMQLVYGDTSVLLTGDTTARIEEYLVTLEGKNLKSNILKAGHHGSKTSNTEAFVSLTDPEWVVISSGKNNSYGHPSKETIETLDKLKIVTLNTCENGRIIFYSNGVEFRLKNKKIVNAKSGCGE